MNRLTLKAKIYFMLGLLIAGFSAGAITGLHQISSRATRDADFAASRTKLEDNVRVMQLTFKKQVQAWKDILLRGSDPESLKEYEAEFLKLDAEVQKEGQELKEIATDPHHAAGRCIPDRPCRTWKAVQRRSRQIQTLTRAQLPRRRRGCKGKGPARNRRRGPDRRKRN